MLMDLICCRNCHSQGCFSLDRKYCSQLHMQNSCLRTFLKHSRFAYLRFIEEESLPVCVCARAWVCMCDFLKQKALM